MTRFTIFVAAVLSIVYLPGCTPPAEEERGEQAAGDISETPAIAPGEAETPTAGPDEAPASRITTEEELRAALQAKNPQFDGQVQVQSDGREIVAVAVNDPAIEDISPLAGLPLQALDLARCHVTDIRPLQGMSLGMLYLEETGVSDLAPLAGMPLTELGLNNTKVEDLGPLKGAPLQKLYLPGTRVSDLSPLSDMDYLDSLWLNDTPVSDITPLRTVPLVSLTLAGTAVADLTPLKGLALKRLHVARSKVTDLTVLEWLQLTRLVFTPSEIKTGIEHARKMRSIREIGTAFGEEGRENDIMPPHVFWPLYDAGEFDNP